eukprot:1492321-Rhodomonas_salina.1
MTSDDTGFAATGDGALSRSSSKRARMYAKIERFFNKYWKYSLPSWCLTMAGADIANDARMEARAEKLEEKVSKKLAKRG